MPNPRLHHYVPACYLKHFAVPNDRYEGRLYVYDRVAGRSFPNNPDKSARERDFYNIKGEHTAFVEHVYAELERRFAPVITEINKRGTLPNDAIAGRELLAFVANQAIRTPRVRELLGCMFGDAYRIAQETVAADKPVLAKKLRDWYPAITDEEVEACFNTRREFANEMDSRGGADQTTLVVNALELAAEVEDLLVHRHWILGVAPDDAQFITSDEPVQLQPARGSMTEDPLWSPHFDDPNTVVALTLSTRLMLIGLARPQRRGRVRMDRRQVASINTEIAVAARRFIYSATPTFWHRTPDGSVAHGPTEILRRPTTQESAAPHSNA